MNESDLKKIIKHNLDQLPQSKWLHTPTTGFFHSGKGTADMLGMWNGLLWWLEFKVHPNKLSSLQEHFLTDCAKLKNVVCLVCIFHEDKMEVRLWYSSQAQRNMEASQFVGLYPRSSILKRLSTVMESIVFKYQDQQLRDSYLESPTF